MSKGEKRFVGLIMLGAILLLMACYFMIVGIGYGWALNPLSTLIGILLIVAGVRIFWGVAAGAFILTGLYHTFLM